MAAGSRRSARRSSTSRCPLRTTILNDVELDPGDGQLLSAHVAPALTRPAAAACRRPIEIEAVDQHGTPPGNPEVTIVVPLYRRTDYLEHQLAQFVHDPELQGADLIYVLDSPEEATRLRTLRARSCTPSTACRSGSRC